MTADDRLDVAFFDAPVRLGDVPVVASGRGRGPQGGLRGLLRWVHGLVVADAEADGLSGRWALWLLWTPVIGAVVVLGTHVSSSLYFWLLKDDHPVEWFQFGTLLVAVGFAACLLPGLHRPGRAWWGLLAVGLLAAASVVAGEEISWAQRVFGLTEPAALAQVNHQDELNLHNINMPGFRLEDGINFCQMLFSLAMTVLPWLVRGPRPVLRAGWWRQITPPTYTVTAFASMFGYRLVRFGLGMKQDTIIVFKQWEEVGFYLAVVAFAVSLLAQYRLAFAPRHRHRGRPASGAPGQPSVVGRGLVLTLVGVSALITVSFAVLTVLSGVKPGN